MYYRCPQATTSTLVGVRCRMWAAPNTAKATAAQTCPYCQPLLLTAAILDRPTRTRHAPGTTSPLRTPLVSTLLEDTWSGYCPAPQCPQIGHFPAPRASSAQQLTGRAVKCRQCVMPFALRATTALPLQLLSPLIVPRPAFVCEGAPFRSCAPTGDILMQHT